eukprot:COSAG02_NODE_2188_length_9569_cov_21.824710_5_plen_49_part_00
MQDDECLMGRNLFICVADFKIVNGINASRTDSKRWQTFQEQLLRSPAV